MGDKSKKLNPVPVRHTLTSMYRLLKANPLLKYQLKGERIPNSDNSTLLKAEFKDKVPERFLPKITTDRHNATVVPKEKQRQPLVRTQSERRVPKKAVVKPQQPPPKKVVKPSGVTTKTINRINKKIDERNNIKPAEKKPEFKTPMQYKQQQRRTIFSTPNSCITKTQPAFASTPGPSAYDLQKRLNDWLRKHGKPIKCYENLKQFRIKHDTISRDEENKENIEVDEDVKKDDSYEELRIVKNVEESQKGEARDIKVEIVRDLQNIAKEALKDLKKLILEGYPREQCEAWLGAIREKYRNLEEEPIYWECLAALEETVGCISTAVEYYKTAIIHGAEVKDVDESLEQMLQKFSLLNIDSSEKNQKTAEQQKYDRNKVVLAARNVFKSSIIQFAIEERKQKKNKNASAYIPEEKKKLIVTPVRRSTRRRTGYIVTPNVDLCSSVEKIRESLPGEMEFRHNQNLAAKFC